MFSINKRLFVGVTKHNYIKDMQIIKKYAVYFTNSV